MRLDNIPYKTGTVDQRREKASYDRRHEWTPVSVELPPRGLICELQFRMMGGSTTDGGPLRYFIDEKQGRWWCIDPPAPLGYSLTPVAWRATRGMLGHKSMVGIKRRYYGR